VTILILIAAGVGLVILVILLIVGRIKVAGPNEAFIITGRRGNPVRNPETGEVSMDMSGQKVVMGASVFVIPFVQKLHIMDLSSRRIPVGITGAVSAQGIKCDLEGVAIVKVGGNEDAIRAAAQRFLIQQQGIEGFTQEVLAGSLRAIVGRLTVEEIIRDRAAFATAVAEEAENSLTNQGLVLDTFQLQDIRAEGDYLADLGRPEAARVKKEASIAEARARQAAEQERILAEEQIAVANRALELRKAEILAETDAAAAEAAAAGPLAKAARDQDVLAEQEKVAERNAALTDRQLDTEIRKPADAHRYQVEQEAQAAKNAAIAKAEANRTATIAAAEATAEQTRLTGEGERQKREALAKAHEIEGRAKGQAQKLEREAVAQAVQAEGQATAAAILATGQAEAEAMEKKAQSFAQYGEAAVIDRIAEILPELVRAASEPVSAIDNMTVVSTDGASSVAKSVAGNLEQGLQIGSALTGVDLKELLASLANKVSSGDLAVSAPVEATASAGPTSDGGSAGGPEG
jgi:flotillin